MGHLAQWNELGFLKQQTGVRFRPRVVRYNWEAPLWKEFSSCQHLPYDYIYIYIWGSSGIPQADFFQHFAGKDHHGFLEDIKVTIIDRLNGNGRICESFWQYTLETFGPLGLNIRLVETYFYFQSLGLFSSFHSYLLFPHIIIF